MWNSVCIGDINKNYMAELSLFMRTGSMTQERICCKTRVGSSHINFPADSPLVLEACSVIIQCLGGLLCESSALFCICFQNNKKCFTEPSAPALFLEAQILKVEFPNFLLTSQDF